MVTECPMSNRCGGNHDHWALSNPPPVTSPVSPALPGKLMSPPHSPLTACSMLAISVLSVSATRHLYKHQHHLPWNILKQSKTTILLSPDTKSRRKNPQLTFRTNHGRKNSLLGLRFLPLLGKSTNLVDICLYSRGWAHVLSVPYWRGQTGIIYLSHRLRHTEAVQVYTECTQPQSFRAASPDGLYSEDRGCTEYSTHVLW